MIICIFPLSFSNCLHCIKLQCNPPFIQVLCMSEKGGRSFTKLFKQQMEEIGSLHELKQFLLLVNWSILLIIFILTEKSSWKMNRKMIFYLWSNYRVRIMRQKINLRTCQFPIALLLIQMAQMFRYLAADKPV